MNTWGGAVLILRSVFPTPFELGGPHFDRSSDGQGIGGFMLHSPPVSEMSHFGVPVVAWL